MMKLKKVVFAFFVGLTTVAVLTCLSAPGLAEGGAKGPQSAIKKAGLVSKDSDYWFDKGALCATYGNNQAAIKYFQKAIVMNPERSGAYFAQGVSYGQLENYVKAIHLINKAIELEPYNGLYHYGRGRVYLLAGKTEKAMADFQKAVQLDDEDAQNYLDMIAGNQ
jgi:tetratricopeptide (TPR) repeat protein